MPDSILVAAKRTDVPDRKLEEESQELVLVPVLECSFGRGWGGGVEVRPMDAPFTLGFVSRKGAK